MRRSLKGVSFTRMRGQLVQNYQLGPANHTLAGAHNRRGKGAFFQAFVIEHKPAGLPMQQLHQGATAIQKYKHLPAGRVPVQFIANQPRQPVEAFAHIADSAIQMVAVGRVQAEHQQRVISWAIRAKSGCPREIRTPLG